MPDIRGGACIAFTKAYMCQIILKTRPLFVDFSLAHTYKESARATKREIERERERDRQTDRQS